MYVASLYEQLTLSQSGGNQRSLKTICFHYQSCTICKISMIFTSPQKLLTQITLDWHIVFGVQKFVNLSNVHMLTQTTMHFNSEHKNSLMKSAHYHVKK
jgi:hypothetical protein